MTGGIGDRAKELSMDLVRTADGLENSSSSKLSAMLQLLKQTEESLETSKELLTSKDITDKLQSCKSSQTEAAKELKETIDCARKALDTVEACKGPIEAKRKLFEQELQTQNDEFEARLKKEHEEFVRMHAKRLAKVMEYQHAL
ncbi:hypothetical protein GGI12_003011 [Dipsacomyces acuminosporus]|nr:hypothetical protein GGI12_003011 [Dipsacomyces acuminosporus]